MPYHEKKEGWGTRAPSTVSELGSMRKANNFAADRLSRGEIGHLKRTDDDLIGRRVLTLDGQVPKEIALEIRVVDWDKGVATVYGGSEYGELKIPIDQLRRIDAALKAMGESIEE